jgi:hypothetical protein
MERQDTLQYRFVQCRAERLDDGVQMMVLLPLEDLLGGTGTTQSTARPPSNDANTSSRQQRKISTRSPSSKLFGFLKAYAGLRDFPKMQLTKVEEVASIGAIASLAIVAGGFVGRLRARRARAGEHGVEVFSPVLWERLGPAQWERHGSGWPSAGERRLGPANLSTGQPTRMDECQRERCRVTKQNIVV